MFHWWLAAMIFVHRHRWFTESAPVVQLPLIPIAAVFAGVTCVFCRLEISSRVVKRSSFDCCGCHSSAFSVFVYARGFYRPSAGPVARCRIEIKSRDAVERAGRPLADNVTRRFVIIRRKGWHFLEKNGIYDGEPRDSAQAIVDLEGLRNRGGRLSCVHFKHFVVGSITTLNSDNIWRPRHRSWPRPGV